MSVKGAAIGNGWFDPHNQYSIADFAYGRGLIGTPEAAAFRQSEIQCKRFLDNEVYGSTACYGMLSQLMKQAVGDDSDLKLSHYDVRKFEKRGKSRSFPPGHKVLETYLGGSKLEDPGTLPKNVYKQVLKAIHAEASMDAGQVFVECSDPPYDALQGIEDHGVVPDIVEILEHPSKVELLFFNGVYDAIVNHVGNELALESLPWTSRGQFVTAQRYAWNARSDPDNAVSGYMREFDNLKFLKVRDSGHM